MEETGVVLTRLIALVKQVSSFILQELVLHMLLLQLWSSQGSRSSFWDELRYEEITNVINL